MDITNKIIVDEGSWVSSALLLLPWICLGILIVVIAYIIHLVKKRKRKDY